MDSLHHSRVIGIFRCLAFACVWLLASAACGPAELEVVPEALTGTWRTSAPGYERSYLRIESGQFTIGMGQFELYEYPIERIELSHGDAGALEYALHYVAEEGYPDKLRLTVDPDVPARFVMGTVSQVWRRDG